MSKLSMEKTPKKSKSLKGMLNDIEDRHYKEFISYKRPSILSYRKLLKVLRDDYGVIHDDIEFLSTGVRYDGGDDVVLYYTNLSTHMLAFVSTTGKIGIEIDFRNDNTSEDELCDQLQSLHSVLISELTCEIPLRYRDRIVQMMNLELFTTFGGGTETSDNGFLVIDETKLALAPMYVGRNKITFLILELDKGGFNILDIHKIDLVETQLSKETHRITRRMIKLLKKNHQLIYGTSESMRMLKLLD